MCRAGGRSRLARGEANHEKRSRTRHRSCSPCEPQKKGGVRLSITVSSAQGPPEGSSSADDRVDDAAVDIGQAEIAASISEGQLFMIESQQMQHGGVQIVQVDRVFDRL